MLQQSKPSTRRICSIVRMSAMYLFPGLYGTVWVTLTAEWKTCPNPYPSVDGPAMGHGRLWEMIWRPKKFWVFTGMGWDRYGLRQVRLTIGASKDSVRLYSLPSSIVLRISFIYPFFFIFSSWLMGYPQFAIGPSKVTLLYASPLYQHSSCSVLLYVSSWSYLLMQYPGSDA